ncbi:MAG TPA: RagB/SusD family nutrient uptake outer membrane protein, partial [Paludibacter sp.]|nr:RagB/SusD family nutrient uptake outer membrane protein [Paludibacter sp.]
SILSLIILLLCFSSCQDYLKEENRNSLTADPFYSTQAGYESLINSCYVPLRLWYGKEDGYGLTETGTDLFTKAAGNTNPTANDYDPIAFNGTNSALTNYWKYFYRGLNSCNAAIARAKAANVTADVRKHRVAEARFLRAFYYWHVVETWGSTHFSTEETKEVQTTANKTAPDVIYKQIFDDLDSCIINSNLSTAKSDNGRITMWAVKALKARLSLTRASETGDVNLYKQAASLAIEVINSGSGKLFTLNPNYKSIWDMSKADGPNNSEVIWYVEYANDNLYNSPEYDDYTIRSGGNNGHLDFCMKYDDQPGMARDIINGRPFNRFMPTLYYVNLFDETKDQRWSGSFKQLWTMNNASSKGTYTNMTDTAIYLYKGIATANQRARATKRYQLYDLKDLYGDNSPAKLNRLRTFSLSKFDDPTRATKDEDRSTRDAFVFRIAEMYLIAAEASMNFDMAQAVSYMNKLREARALPGKTAQMDIAAADMTIDFILDERARELGGEQLRWFDLKRIPGKFLTRIQDANPDAAKNVKSWHMVRPIPRTQLDAVFNKEEFKQNPEYVQ